MKQNTKFLWIYIAILFSFAIILIIFAGLSHNNEDEQKKGLKQDLTELSQKNTELQGTVSDLQKQIDALTQENTSLKAENETAKAEATQKNDNDAILAAAITEYKNGNKTKAKQTIGALLPENLTETQLYIYNMIKSKVTEER